MLAQDSVFTQLRGWNTAYTYIIRSYAILLDTRGRHIKWISTITVRRYSDRGGELGVSL